MSRRLPHTARTLVGCALLTSAVLAAPSIAQQQRLSDVPQPSSVPGVPTPVEALREFPEVLAAMQDTGAPELQSVAPGGQLGRAGRGRLVWSSLPLEVDGDPVERALQVERGVATPANPLVDVELPLDPAAQMHVGEGSSAFSVTAISASDGEHQLLGDGVVHMGTHEDTDTVARAVTGGVETYELIGSAQAPDRFRYRVTGATPRAGDEPGVIELVDRGKAIGSVTAPVVVDSGGAPVGASLTADGDTVVFSVAHREPGVTYPVLADPLWTADYAFSNADQGSQGLYVGEFPEGAENYDVGTNNGSSASPIRGITIRPKGGRVYQENDRAIATFAAPPGSTITSAAFNGVYRYNNLDRQVGRLALYGGGPPIVNDYFGTDVRTDASIVLTDPTQSARFAQIWMHTPTCAVGEPSCPRLVAPTNTSRITVNQLVVTLNDPGAPTTTLAGSVAGLGESWRQPQGTHTLDLTASDNGSGVASWRIVRRQGAAEHELAAETVACDPTHSDDNSGQGAFVCPEADSITGVPVDLAQLGEGRIQLRGQATDYAENVQDGASSQLSLRLDGSSPTLDPLGGSLLANPANRWQQIRGTKQVFVKAADTYSGVKTAEAVVGWGTGDTAASLDFCTPQGSVDQPCPTQAEGSADINGDALPDGPLSVSAKVTDFVGLSTDSASVQLYKDNTNPAATARGELADLEGKWTSDVPTKLVLEGKDRRSGISRLELWATDSTGRRLVEDALVCDPTTIDASLPDGHCPKAVKQPTSVDLTSLETGEVTLEAYAVDAAGNRDPNPESWDTFVDYDPPSPVGRINAFQLSPDSIRVSWQPATDEGSGLAGYEYRLSTEDGTRTSTWQTTPFPGAEIPTDLAIDFAELKDRVTVEVRAKDKTGLKGKITQGALSVADGNSEPASRAGVARADPRWLTAKGYFRVSSWCRGSLPRWATVSDKYSTERKTYTESRVRVRAATTVSCRRESGSGYKVRKIVVSAQLRPIDTADLEDPAFSESHKRGPFSAPRSVGLAVTHDCTPGKRVYELRVHFRAEVENFRTGLLHKDWIVNDATSAAPDRFSMECNRAGMWRIRVYESSVADGKRHKPSYFLRKALNASSWHVDSIAGDHAHHLIPTYLRSSYWQAVQARGYSCRVRPNEQFNGAFLPTWLHNQQHGRPAAERLRGTVDRALIKSGATWNGGCRKGAADAALKAQAIALEKQGRR